MLTLDWKKGESTEADRPADLELGVQKVKVRKDITRETKTTDTGTMKVWTYTYATMTPAQYETYKDELAQLDTPFAQMIQSNYDTQLDAAATQYEQSLIMQENQEAIIEGLADLFEK